ncbi:LemA family protein [Patescibacteria group bacterium]|nr:LemA family protein [Patescibacteria group bacterium]MBU1499909.1 LemA family protein [Patescibacteria group bacterium]
MSLSTILLIIVIVIGLYVLSIYNKFKTTDVRIKASIQEIGNQLKRQADLIPNLVASVKGYFKHEQTALTKITDARKSILSALKSGGAQNLVDAAGKLQGALGGINAVFESTPELQAAGPTKQLMDEVRDTSDKLMYSRRTLIDLSADYNTMIETVPSSLIAGLFKFQAKPGLKTPETGSHLEVSSADTKTPQVDL